MEQGYRVLVVEQTETPEQLENRRREMGSKDKVIIVLHKIEAVIMMTILLLSLFFLLLTHQTAFQVVRREICAVVTKGTLTEGEMLAANPDASYLMAVTESSLTAAFQQEKRTYGVCMVDISTGRVIIGQVQGNSL